MSRTTLGRFGLTAVFLLILSPRGGSAQTALEGFVQGPDLVVGDMADLAQFGTSAPHVGLGTSGVALVEAYTYGAPLAPFTNMSTRALVSTGDDRVIGGFILGGHPGARQDRGAWYRTASAVFGVENALADPTLELRDGNGALVLANNNWQDDPAQAAEITAAGLAPESPFEAGIAATLGPGLYTALLAGTE